MTDRECSAEEHLPPGIHPVPFRRLRPAIQRILRTCSGDGVRLERELRQAVEAIPVLSERQRVTHDIWAALGVTPPTSDANRVGAHRRPV